MIEHYSNKIINTSNSEFLVPTIQNKFANIAKTAIAPILKKIENIIDNLRSFYESSKNKSLKHNTIIHFSNITDQNSNNLYIQTSNKALNIEISKNNALELIKVKDNRSNLVRINSLAKAFFNCLSAAAKRIFWTLSENPSHYPVLKKIHERYCYPPEELPWAKSSESPGLTVFIHGLWGSPSNWNEYVEHLKKIKPNCHIFNPYVLNKGNCDLKTAAQPILNAIENYLVKFPGKPIHIVGTSNGGRIAMYIESHINSEILGKSKLSIASIAGVHYGTKFVNLLKRSQLEKLTFLNKGLANEFLYASEVAKKNLILWKEKQKLWKEGQHQVRHLFCATTEDELVRSLKCSLPYDPSAKSDYKIYINQSHLSIVDKAKSDVLDWLNGD